MASKEIADRKHILHLYIGAIISWLIKHEVLRSKSHSHSNLFLYNLDSCFFRLLPSKHKESLCQIVLATKTKGPHLGAIGPTCQSIYFLFDWSKISIGGTIQPSRGSKFPRVALGWKSHSGWMLHRSHCIRRRWHADRTEGFTMCMVGWKQVGGAQPTPANPTLAYQHQQFHRNARFSHNKITYSLQLEWLEIPLVLFYLTFLDFRNL